MPGRDNFYEHFVEFSLGGRYKLGVFIEWIFGFFEKLQNENNKNRDSEDEQVIEVYLLHKVILLSLLYKNWPCPLFCFNVLDDKRSTSNNSCFIIFYKLSTIFKDVIRWANTTEIIDVDTLTIEM